MTDASSSLTRDEPEAETSDSCQKLGQHADSRRAYIGYGECCILAELHRLHTEFAVSTAATIGRSSRSAVRHQPNLPLAEIRRIRLSKLHGTVLNIQKSGNFLFLTQTTQWIEIVSLTSCVSCGGWCAVGRSL
jgi:hypothetical protein